MQQLLTLQTTSSTPHAIALDAGDGREIAAIASVAGIAKDHTWAVCNDAAQAEEAAKHVGHVIHAEATGCRLAEAGASLAPSATTHGDYWLHMMGSQLTASSYSVVY